jgi:hypothetical protein
VLLILSVLSNLIAMLGWIMYWRTLPGTRLLGEINGLIPECKMLRLSLPAFCVADTY